MSALDSSSKNPSRTEFCYTAKMEDTLNIQEDPEEVKDNTPDERIGDIEDDLAVSPEPAESAEETVKNVFADEEQEQPLTVDSGLSLMERLCLKLTIPLVQSEFWISRDGLMKTLFPKKPRPGTRSREFYDPAWWKSYDAVLLAFTVAAGLILLILTVIYCPFLFTELFKANEEGGEIYWPFWFLLLIRMLVMMVSSYLGGLAVLCLGLRMNYTRKIQHFAAYLIPLTMDLIFKVEPPKGENVHVEVAYLIMATWGYYAVILSFTTLVYPLRNLFRFIDVQFIALDRPEDRPYTLQWMTTQVMIGDLILVAFKWYFKFHMTGMANMGNLVFIPTLIVGIGDGLAEPVGITWGYHKYKTRSCSCDGREYTRSYEGSATVLISGYIFVVAFYTFFENYWQFIITLILMPPIMTIAEAVSPHTWDTPLMMLLGCGLLLGIAMLV